MTINSNFVEIQMTEKCQFSDEEKYHSRYYLKVKYMLFNFSFSEEKQSSVFFETEVADTLVKVSQCF